jgi:hypothetical protein
MFMGTSLKTCLPDFLRYFWKIRLFLCLNFATKGTLNLTKSARRFGVLLGMLFCLLPLKSVFAVQLPPNFDRQSLEIAINAGGTITFTTNSVLNLNRPIIITGTNAIVFDGTLITTNIVYTNLVVNGSNVVVNGTNVVVPLRTNDPVIATGDKMVGFSGGSNAFCLFQIGRRANVTFNHIQFLNGGGSGPGGAISNAGTLILTNAFFSNNRVRGSNGVNGSIDNENGGNGFGALGGALYNSGTSKVFQCSFVKNSATAGKGGLGKNGASDSLFGKDGGNGGNGGTALGGAIFNTGKLILSETTFEQNGVTAGDGNFAGVGGSAPFPGKPGNAGSGGLASGGAVYNMGTSRTDKSLFFRNFSEGGNSADQFSFEAGIPGGNANGGAVFNGSTLYLINSTLASNLCIAGFGGGVQSGGFIFGGTGGTASGGSLHNISVAHLTNCTFIGGSVSNGLGGISLNGDGQHNGASGVARGGNICAPFGSINLLNCIVGYGTPANSFGFLANSSFNLSSDSSCLFGGTANLQPVADLKVKPLADNGGPTFTIALAHGSPAINAGTKLGAPTVDQRGTNRFARPDIGAFELVGPFTVAGRVTFGTNRPIAHVVINVLTNIVLTNETNSTLVTSVTNDFEGNYSIKLAEGTYTIIPEEQTNTGLIFKPVGVTNKIVNANIPHLNFSVDGLFVKGIVTNLNGRGLAGVPISVTNPVYHQSFSVTTGTKGFFLLTDIPLGTNIVTPLGQNAIFVKSSATVTNSSTNQVNFLRIPTYTVSGVISGSPIDIVNHVPVILRTNGSTNGVLTFSDFVGRFTFTNVLTGNYTVMNNSTSLVFDPPSRPANVLSNITGLKFTVTTNTTP